MSLNAGDVFAQDYRVVRLIKAGAMGIVYEVEQLSTGAARALKVMAPDLVGDPAIRHRFQLEARVGAQIQSDHIVEVIAAGVEPQRQEPYLVMELLAGETLEDLCQRMGRLSPGDMAEVVRQFAHGLAAAHALGIVHRDLKPDNLFIAHPRGAGKHFTVKILDFGIAKSLSDAHRQTQALGTPLYMAPEQTLTNGEVGPATDVWAMGLIVFRCLVGREYWRSSNDTLLALLKDIAETPLAAASERARELDPAVALPAGFDEWFARCVIRDMGSRFTDGAAAGAAFLELVPEAQRQVTIKPEVSASQPRLSLPSPLVADGPTIPTPRVTLLSGTPVSVAPGAQRPRSMRVAPLFGIGAGVLAAGLSGFALIQTPEPARDEPLANAVTTIRPSTSAAAPVASQGSESPAPCPTDMVHIAGGPMFMGETAGAGNASPAHQVTLSPYCLDKTEVTAGAYEACVNAGACPRALNSVSYKGVTPKLQEVFAKLCNFRQSGRQTHPINCVDWDMATHYCSAKGGRLREGGGRLPTEAEWEFAARGSAQWLYPWGDEAPDETRLNACGEECAAWQREVQGAEVTPLYTQSDGYPGTSPVGAFPGGATKAGILDLAGNVWEWTSDWFEAYTSAPLTDPKGPASGTQRVVRGGGFNGVDAAWAKPSYRWKTTPETFTHVIGFRCAAAPKDVGAECAGPDCSGD